MRWLKRLVLSSVVVLAISAPAQAAEQIPNFSSKLTVQQSGRVDVVETIDYDFGDAARHGIYRYIPVVYSNKQNQVFKPGFGFDSAMVDSQPVAYETSSEGDNIAVKIGEAATTITGQHAYTIAYHFDSLLVQKDGDLLRFNVTGNGWKVPIKSALIEVSGPENFKTTCYVGATGTTEKRCDIEGLDTQTASVMTKGGLSPGDGFTIESLWPSGTVATLLQPYKTPWWVSILIIAGLIYVALGIVLLIAAAIRWLGICYAEQRAQKSQTIVAQYEPPKDLTPGEIGLLEDNKTSVVEVTATLIQAAVRGYIKIEQVVQKSLLKKAEYKLSKPKDFAGLEANEQYLLTVLFDGKSEINLKDIDKTTVPSAIKKYQDSLRESLKDKGMYTKQSKFATAALASFAILIFLAFTPFIFLAGVALVPMGLYGYKRAGQTPRRTPEGLQVWAYVEGFKIFLSVTEKDRLAFTDAPTRTPKQFSEFLPYAIALGVEKEWAKQFEGIDIAQSMGWYGGNTQAFTAGYLVGNLTDSFASTVASSVAPQASSGSFGGGSSGGGFGGGGGGSW